MMDIIIRISFAVAEFLIGASFAFARLAQAIVTWAKAAHEDIVLQDLIDSMDGDKITISGPITLSMALNACRRRKYHNDGITPRLYYVILESKITNRLYTCG